MPPLEPVSGWQIASTISTSAATVIALVVVVLNLMQRRRDRDLARVQGEAQSRFGWSRGVLRAGTQA